MPDTDNTNALITSIILQQEGGWKLSKDADGGDGGWTFAGITAKTASTFFGLASYTYDQIAEIITNTASAEYQELQQAVLNEYAYDYVPTFFPDIPAESKLAYLSCAINCGPGTAKAIWSTTEPDHNNFLHAWAIHYVRICQANPAKLQYLAGWLNRIESCR